MTAFVYQASLLSEHVEEFKKHQRLVQILPTVVGLSHQSVVKIWRTLA